MIRTIEDEKQDLEEIEAALDTLKYMVDDVKELIDDYKDKLNDPKFNEKEFIISAIKNYYIEALKAILQKADLEKRYWELTPYERDTLHMID